MKLAIAVIIVFLGNNAVADSSLDEIPFYKRLSGSGAFTDEDKKLVFDYCPAVFATLVGLLRSGLDYRSELEPGEREAEISEYEGYFLDLMRHVNKDRTPLIAAVNSLLLTQKLHAYMKDGRDNNAEIINDYNALFYDSIFCRSVMPKKD